MTGPPLWQLVQRWEEGRRQGREPTAAELCHDCPQLMAEVARLLPVLRAIPSCPADEVKGGPGSLTLRTLVFKPPTLPLNARELSGDALAPPGYEILEEIGRGGMGVVYKARQMRLDRVVALKMILAQGHASLAERLRFQDEARAVAAIQHPGVVQIYEVGEHSGLPFFALEFCPEGSLAERLKGTPLEPREAAWVVERLARAVQAAHDKGIIHRDLKPANVLLAPAQDAVASAKAALTPGQRLNGLEPKITDFGLAKKLEEAGITRPGELMGTPSYMAPEQAGRETVGRGCDVYALGAILYECLTGRPPFRGATMLETLEQVRFNEPVSVRALAPSAPRDLETICLKCLRKDAGQRYQSAQELAEDLRRWQHGEPIVARPVGPVERAVKAVRRRPLVWALIAAVVLTMAGGTVVSLIFAHEASDRAAAARRSEAETLASNEQLREARGQIQQTLAAGLLRPLGHSQGFDRLNEFELKALADLAGLPRVWEGVRVLLIEQALQQPATAGQLERRMEPILIAALGLDVRKRQEVLAGLARRLASPGTVPEVRRTSARLAVALEADDPGLVKAAAAGLLDALTRAGDADTLRQLAADYSRLVGRLDPTEARAGASVGTARLLELIKDSTEDEELKGLSEAYLALEGRLDEVTAQERAAVVAERLRLAIPRAQEVFQLKALAGLLVRLSGRLDAREAKTTAAQLLEFLTEETSNPEVLEALAEVLARVAPRQDPQASRTTLADASARIRGLFARSTDGLALKPLARALVRLGGAGPDDTAGAAAHVLETLRKSEDVFGVEALVETYVTLSSHLDRKATEEGAARGLQHLLDGLAEGADEFTLEPLARAAVRLASCVGPRQARKGAERLAGLLRNDGDPATMEPLTLAFAGLAGKLDPAEAQALTAPVVASIHQCMLHADNADALSRLRRCFAHLVERLEPAQAQAARNKVAARLRDETARTSDPIAQAELLGAVLALEKHEGKPLPAAAEAAARLLKAAAGQPEVAPRLARIFANLAPYMEPTTAREGAAAMLYRILDRRQALDDDHAVLLRQLAPGQLVNLLKHPCCTGPARRRVLDQLGARLQVPLASVWDLARLAHVLPNGVDLLAPAEFPSAGGATVDTPARLEVR